MTMTMTDFSSSSKTFDILRRQLTWVYADARFFSALFERAPEPLLVVDSNGRIHAANDAACHVHAVDRREIVRLRLRDLLPPSVDLCAAAEELRDRGEASLEFSETGADGATTRTRLEGRRFLPDRYVVSFRELGAERQSQLDTTAMKIVHDVNNLLAPILCYADELGTRTALDPDVASIVAEMRAAAQRAASLTKTVLALGSALPSESPAIVQMNEVVAQMQELLVRLATGNIEVVVRLAPDLAAVYVEREELERLLLNLALNARDAMPRGGRLVFETANVDRIVKGRTERCAMVAVSDTGIGMDAATRARMFEPFFTTKPQGAGTGLGLSTARAFVKRNRGSIEVETEPGRGTKIRVLFPQLPSGAG
jgi:signal transduction histidine kinase